MAAAKPALLHAMLARLLKSSLFRAASIYGLGNLLRQALPVFLAPILTRHLSPEDYGTTAIFGLLIGIFTPFIGLSIHGAINRKYFDRDLIDFPAYVFNCLLILAVGTVLAFALLPIAGGLIAKATEFPRTWLWAAIAVTTGQMVSSAMLSLLQVSGRPAFYAVVQLGRTLLIAGLTLWFVVGLGQDWRGSVNAQVVGTSVFALLALTYLASAGWLRPRVDKDYILHAAGFGAPLILHSLSGVIIQAVDRLFVSHYAGLGQTGIYSIGYQLGSMIGLLEDSFNQAWQPWFFERLRHGTDKDKRNIVAFTYGYFVAITLAAFTLGFVAPWVLSILVSKNFQGAYIHVVWIAMGYAFNGMYKMVSGYIFYAEKTGWLGWMTFAAAASNVGLNILLVPRFGAIGAAQATTGAFFLSFLLSWILAARVYPMPWGSFWKRQVRDTEA